MKKSSLIDQLTSNTIDGNLFTPGSTLIIGLSGGPDSIFLLHFFCSIANDFQLTLIAAHLDHGWRPESAQDAQFCKKIAQGYKVRFVTKTLQELDLSLKSNGSQEEMGRKARRFFFESLAQQYQAQAIALGHHADDQQETFFMRLIRGSSLAGLSGIKAKDGLYIHPLLILKKVEIINYLNEYAIAYTLDPSNESKEYLRNRIRTEVIPALKKADARWDDRFAATHTQLQETEEFLKDLTHLTFEQLSNASGQLSISGLLQLHPILAKRVILIWLIKNKVRFSPSQSLFDEIGRFLSQTRKGKHTLYGSWQIKKEGDRASIMLLTIIE
jgi:tRNA(Ile)-lysidine synthase